MPLEVCCRPAGVRGDRNGVGTGRFETPLQLEREQQVGELALPVRAHGVVSASREIQIVEHDRARSVGLAGHGDDTRLRGPAHKGHEERGQGEVTRVVHTELALESLCRAALGARHDTGVVDEQIQSLGATEHLVRKAANRLQVRQIEPAELGLLLKLFRLDARHRCFALLAAAATEDHARSLLGQRARRLETDPRVGPGHDGDPSVLPGHVFVGPPLLAHSLLLSLRRRCLRRQIGLDSWPLPQPDTH